MVQRARLSTILSGVSGEYFVAAELSRRGCIASITLRNTRGIDILAATGDTSESAVLQVKTNQDSKKEWVLNKKAETEVSDDLFYVFVNLHGLSGNPEYHIVPSAVVADRCRKTHADYLATPGQKGQKHKDSDMRKFSDRSGQYLGRWDKLNLRLVATE